jgi:hypothetical protein
MQNKPHHHLIAVFPPDGSPYFSCRIKARRQLIHYQHSKNFMHKPEAFWHQNYYFCYKINRAIKGLILTRKVKVSNQDWRSIIKTQICYIIYDYDSYLNTGGEPTPETTSIFMYLFIYDLFKNTVRNSACIESNDRKGNEWYIGKYVQRKGMA